MKEKFGISTKKYMLEELKAKFQDSPNFVITNYKGLSSQEIEKLRKELNKSSSRYFVVKNSIVKQALDDLELKDLNKFIDGEVGISFVGDIIGAAKTLCNFLKDHSTFKIQSAVIDGKVESTDRIKRLAVLPPLDGLRAIVLACMKNPITNFVGILSGLLRNLVYAVNEIKKKKEGGDAE